MKKADSQLRPNRRQVLATMGAVGAVGLGGVHGMALERRAGKAGMVADAHRVYALHQGRQLIQMPEVQPHGRAQRKPHTVKAHRVQGTPLLQHRQCRATAGKEIFGMDFQKINIRAALQQLAVVRVAPANADAGHQLGSRQRRH